MSTHTPTTSAAMAAPTFKGTAILLIVTQFLSVYTFDHDSAAALAIVSETSISEATYRFPGCGDVFPVDIDFSSSLCANVGPVVAAVVIA